MCLAQAAAEGEWQARIDNQRRKFPFTPGWFEARRLKHEAYRRFLEAHERVEEALSQAEEAAGRGRAVRLTIKEITE